MSLARVIQLLNYERLDDEELARRSREGDRRACEALIRRYADFVRLKAGSYYMAGAEPEDLFQEGMIGLYKAVRDYRPERESSFKSFAELCVTRQIITAVKASTRRKHLPLNNYVSLTSPPAASDEEGKELIDFIGQKEALDPAELIIGEEEAESFRREFWRTLSGLETEVLRLYMSGKSYREIATGLHRQVKSIDNALQRIKRKVVQHRLHRELMASGLTRGGARSVAG